MSEEELRIKTRKEHLYSIMNNLKGQLLNVDINIEHLEQLILKMPDHSSDLKAELIRMEAQKESLIEVIDIVYQRIKKEEIVPKDSN